jgi:hypothetical protein
MAFPRIHNAALDMKAVINKSGNLFPAKPLDESDIVVNVKLTVS